MLSSSNLVRIKPILADHVESLKLLMAELSLFPDQNRY